MTEQLQQHTQAAAQGLAPTNAEALALLDAYGNVPLDDADMSTVLAPLMVHRMLAHGYVRYGDKFRGADNGLHYAARYPETAKLLADLAVVTQASDAYLERSGEAPPIVKLNMALARGDRAALQSQLDRSWTALQAARSMAGIGDIINSVDWKRAMEELAKKFAAIFERIGRLPGDIARGIKFGAGAVLVLLLIIAVSRRR